MEQTRPDFGASVFEHGKPIAEIECAVAALAAFFFKADCNSSLAAEPSQSAQQLISGHAWMNMTPAHCRQASGRTPFNETGERSVGERDFTELDAELGCNDPVYAIRHAAPDLSPVLLVTLARPVIRPP